MNPSAPTFIVLHSRNSTVVLEACADAAPLWRYWGHRLPDATLPPSSLQEARPTPPASLEFDQPLSLAPTFGNGWFGQAALLAHRSGQQFAHVWNSCEIDRTNAQQLVVTLRDSVAALRLIISMWLDTASDMLTINSCLHNDGASVLTVQWLAAATLPLPATSQRVNSYTGQWANELQPQSDLLSRSTWRRENTRGRTSHDCFPAATILENSGPHGNAYGAHLGWSGNHAQTIEWQHDGQYQWQLGEWLAPGEVQLQQHEILQSPSVYAAFTPHGLNGLAQSFHATVRALLPWHQGMMSLRPVHLNTWEAVYFDHNEADLKILATTAAEIGVERFVLDDGWFQGRHHDCSGLGDWQADSTKYPQGLLPLANHVVSCGMAFGLWIEPEMVNADSDLFRAHPDWVLQLEGRPLLTGRNQLVLDIANPDVAQYLFTQLNSLLKTLPISYLKWDMNRDITHAASSQLNRQSAQYRAQSLAVYALFTRLSMAYPSLEIESCASGGGRLDYGILHHTHRVWVSDCNDALSRITIQHGALQWLPPEIIGSHIGATPAHTTGRSQSLAFRAAVALTSHFGLEMDIRKLDTIERAELTQWIQLYKSLRTQLHQGQVWRSHADDVDDGVVWQAHGDAHSIILLIYRISPTTQRWSPQIKLPMLDAAQTYLIAHLEPPSKNAPQVLHTAVHGAWLRHTGLALPRMLAETAMVLRLVAQP